MSQYRFVSNGDYVDFYDDSMHVIKLHNTSRCVTWLFDDTIGVTFHIGDRYYHVDDVAEVLFDEVAPETIEDFKAAMISMFPDLAGGEGGGVTSVGNVGAGNSKGASISGSVLTLHNATETQPGLISVDTNQTIGGNKSFSGTVQFQNPGKFETIQLIKEISEPSSPAAGYVSVYAKTDKDLYLKDSDGNEFNLSATGIDDVLAEGQVLTADRFINAGGNAFSIKGTTYPDGLFRVEDVNGLVKIGDHDGHVNSVKIEINDGAQTITHTAGTHTYNAGGQEYLSLDGIGFRSRIVANDGTATAQLALDGDIVDDGVKFLLQAYDGVNDIRITGNAVANSITHTAGTHNFATGDLIITNLAGGGTTGLSIDNDGKIIRTT